MTITLDAIKTEHTRIGDMIAAFEKQAATEYVVAGVTIKLNPGERYAGLILGENGEADYHLILLPNNVEDKTWEQAKEWAASIGGELPTRREQAMLFANLKAEFESAWYWSGEAHEKESGWAWCQGFYDGSQDCYLQYDELRARAVRRLVLQ